MGGSSYARDIGSTSFPSPSTSTASTVSSTSSSTASSEDVKHYYTTANKHSASSSSKIFSQQALDMIQTNLAHTSVHADVKPSRSIELTSGTGVVCALDVTGSMGNWLKVFLDKLPMFYGQLIAHGIAEPQLSVAVFGDAIKDNVRALQVTDFAEGLDIDTQVAKLWLTHSGLLAGAGNGVESANLAAYYYAHKCTLPPLPEANRDQKHFFFMTGDEPTYMDVDIKQFAPYFNPDDIKEMTTSEIFNRLKEKFHVFFILKTCEHKPYLRKNPNFNDEMFEFWAGLVGENRILPLE